MSNRLKEKKYIFVNGRVMDYERGGRERTIENNSVLGT